MSCVLRIFYIGIYEARQAGWFERGAANDQLDQTDILLGLGSRNGTFFTRRDSSPSASDQAFI